MAASIPAGAPQAPLNRKQISDAEGNFTPVRDEVPVAEEVPEVVSEPAAPFAVGDLVKSEGRILEIHHPQGGIVSVKVQMASGADWYRGEHLVKVEEPAPLSRNK